MTAKEESVLVNLALSGNDDAITQLYSDNNKKVLSVLLKLTHNVEDAEDLTSQTFQRVFRKLHLFQGKSRLFTWIYRIAFNEFCMSARKKKLITIHLSEKIKEDLHIQNTAYKKIQLSEVINKINLLSTQERKLLILAGYGFSSIEVSQSLDLKPSTIKTRLHKTRKKFKELYWVN